MQRKDEQEFLNKEMEDLGYELTHVEGHSDFFLMWKEKSAAGNENAFGLDGWKGVEDFVYDLRMIMNNYTREELQNRLNGNYSLIEYSIFNSDDIQRAFERYPETDKPGIDEYREKIKVIHDYEIRNNIPEIEKMTEDRYGTVLAKPWIKTDQKIMSINQEIIAARYDEIINEKKLEKQEVKPEENANVNEAVNRPHPCRHRGR